MSKKLIQISIGKMSEEVSSFFTVLKEHAQIIAHNLSQVEKELALSSLFGDPCKAGQSEAVIDKVLEDVRCIKGEAMKLVEETEAKNEDLLSFKQEMVLARKSMFQQVILYENELKKYGYKPTLDFNEDIFQHEIDTSEDKLTECQDGIGTPLSSIKDQTYLECITPDVSNRPSRGCSTSNHLSRTLHFPFKAASTTD